MKLVISCLMAFNLFALKSGEYQCLKGNNDSICKQRVKVYGEYPQITALKVTYAGYCDGMGSNTFYCQNLACESGLQKIKINKQSYSWENTVFNIRCDEFKLSKKVNR